MEITLDIPDNTVRKIRALGTLRGRGSNTVEIIVGLIDQIVTDGILNELGVSAADAVPSNAVFVAPAVEEGAEASFLDSPDHSGISAGLGDDNPEESAKSSDEMAFVDGSGVRAEEVEHDMDVDDPTHEAKALPPTVSPAQPAERTFVDIAGMPGVPAGNGGGVAKAKPVTAVRGGTRQPAVNETRDPRIARRRKDLRSRAIVTGFTGSEESTF